MMLRLAQFVGKGTVCKIMLIVIACVLSACGGADDTPDVRVQPVACESVAVCR